MDGTTVARAAELAAGDGEFLLNARGWTGTLTVAADGAAWRVPVEAGAPGAPAPAPPG